MELIGKRFGRLVVKAHPATMWVVCVCDCGVEKTFYKSNVILGKSKSCGCLAMETTGNRARSHGMSKTKVYMVWSRMWARCTTPTVDRYPRYGGRGIKVCERWATFENFYEDMGDLPTPKHSIGRIDNDGNYEPGNCRWETPKEQAANTSTTRFLEFNGTRKSLAEWATETGIPHNLIYQRVAAGMQPDKVLERRNMTERPITFGGVTRLTTEWMKELPIPISSFYHFRRKGMSEEEIVRKYAEKGVT